MKIDLHNGCCEARHQCKNVGKDICHVLPKNHEDYINCNCFEQKGEKRR